MPEFQLKFYLQVSTQYNTCENKIVINKNDTTIYNRCIFIKKVIMKIKYLITIESLKKIINSCEIIVHMEVDATM